MPLPRDEDELERVHEEAWVGDAVLALWAREWVLERDGHRDGEKMVRLTCNQFLASFGNPTAVEAEIGRVYRAAGLQAAFDYCRERFVRRFEAEEKNRSWAESQKPRGKRGQGYTKSKSR